MSNRGTFLVLLAAMVGLIVVGGVILYFINIMFGPRM